MLYNPAWRDPAPLTLPKLIAWLERQPPSQNYDYLCNDGCLLALYVRGKGYPAAMFGGDYWRPEGSDTTVHLSPTIWGIACGLPWTFGAAMARAKMSLAEQEGRAP